MKDGIASAAFAQKSVGATVSIRAPLKNFHTNSVLEMGSLQRILLIQLLHLCVSIRLLRELSRSVDGEKHFRPTFSENMVPKYG